MCCWVLFGGGGSNNKKLKLPLPEPLNLALSQSQELPANLFYFISGNFQTVTMANEREICDDN